MKKSQFFERTDKIALFLLVVCLGFMGYLSFYRKGCICVSSFDICDTCDTSDKGFVV